MKKQYIKPVQNVESMSFCEIICVSVGNGGTTEDAVIDADVKEFGYQTEFGNLW